MAPRASQALAAVIAMIAASGGACTCSKSGDPAAADEAGLGGDAASAEDPTAAPHVIGAPGGLSAPIAAVHGEQGDVVVAGLDVPARSIRVQRISAKDEVLADRTVLEGVAWSTESELKVLAAGPGVAIMWRGLRGGTLVRQVLILGADLAPQGKPFEVDAASCATKDALWSTDGKRARMQAWPGSALTNDLPRDKEASLLCGTHRAIALLDDDDGTSFVALGDPGTAPGGKEARAAAASAAPSSSSAAAPSAWPGGPRSAVVRLFEDAQFGEDESRERSEYTIGDDFGVVRLAVSGAVALREVVGGVSSPLRRLKTSLSRDADVVAVDASPRAVVIVYTEDVSGCAADKGAGTSLAPRPDPSSSASTRVKALRVDRTNDAESIVELSPGACGREVGPFFTQAMGDAVSVAWVERVATAGKSRAPIAGLAHRLVAPSGAIADLAFAEQPADALVDAGCDAARCYAVALARRPGMDAMVPGLARVVRY